MTWANTIDSSLLRAWTNVDKERTVTDPQLSEFLILRPQKSTSIFQTESSNKRPAQTLIFFYHSGGFWDPSRDFPLPNRTEESFTLISSWTCFSSIYFTCTSSSCCRFCLPYLLFICPALNGIPLKSAWSWCLAFGRSFCVLYCLSVSFALKDLIFPEGSVGQWWCYICHSFTHLVIQSVVTWSSTQCQRLFTSPVSPCHRLSLWLRLFAGLRAFSGLQLADTASFSFS